MRLEKNSETWGEMKQEIAKSDSCEKKDSGKSTGTSSLSLSTL